ncbi:MAG TPA: molybdopterin-dependent oxidoreductase [Anaerolineaceae bacterium]|nr:molybdopterin-dependent oxidoreductase [Anaerolineaceae bacterium]
MKKCIWIILVLILAAVLLAACQSSQLATPTAANTVAPTVQPAVSETALTITGPQGSKTLTLDDLEKMPAVEGQAGIKSSTGAITPPALYKGVLLTDLVQLVGGLNANTGVQIGAKDGYDMTFSADQITQGNFVTYDPATGDEITNAGKLQVLIAYEMNGKPLDSTQDGTLKLVVISDKPTQITDGHWAVRFINSIELKALAAAWSLDLQGAISDTVDRGTFESCSTSTCHQAGWTDGKAQKWTGTPLYLLVGRVDDNTKHGTGAFNTQLADQGYTIAVVGKDGYTATFTSAQIKDDKNIIVANQVNGNELADKDFPLKLVGSELTNKQMVGGIAKIILHLSGQAGGSPTAAAPMGTMPAATTVPAATQSATTSSSATLALTGLVQTQENWSLSDLKNMNVATMTVDVPKQGQQQVQGIHLNGLLNMAQLKPGAKSLIFTASDGYSVTLDLSTVQSCTDCLVAFNDSGGFSTVMPNLPGSDWVKNVVKMEVK